MAGKREISRLNNAELASIYDYLTGAISHAQLVKEVKRMRTNTYYYVGRACDEWISMGILKFERVTRPEDLGGVEEKKGDF